MRDDLSLRVGLYLALTLAGIVLMAYAFSTPGTQLTVSAIGGLLFGLGGTKLYLLRRSL